MAELCIQNACKAADVPADSDLKAWVNAALAEVSEDVEALGEVVVRIVGQWEIQNMNAQFRAKHKPTNVLSFPTERIAEIPNMPLGDIVVCADVVRREAAEQGKTLDAHWAHMLVHASLHLLGYDHQQDAEAQVMEDLERKILAALGFADPYLERDETNV